jgi:hypothetical protein
MSRPELDHDGTRERKSPSVAFAATRSESILSVDPVSLVSTEPRETVDVGIAAIETAAMELLHHAGGERDID